MKRIASKPRQMRPFHAGRARRLLVPGLALMLAAGCAGDGADGDDVALSEGHALYQENCAVCHGEEALGDGPMASSLPIAPPPLKEHLGHHTQAQLIGLIQGGVPPAMPPTPLSEGEIQQIVDYLWTLVPEDEVEALRQMQQQMEMMGDSAGPMGGMPGMGGMESMPGMDSMHSGHSMEMNAPMTPADSGSDADTQ